MTASHVPCPSHWIHIMVVHLTVRIVTQFFLISEPYDVMAIGKQNGLCVLVHKLANHFL